MTGKQMKRYARSMRRLAREFELKMLNAKRDNEIWCSMGICNWLNFVANDIEAMLKGHQPTFVKVNDDSSKVPDGNG